MRLALALTKQASPLRVLPLLFDSRRAIDQVLVRRITGGTRVHAEGVDVVGMSLAR